MRETFDSLCAKRVSYILTTKDRPEFMAGVLLNLGMLKEAQDEIIVVDASTDGTTYRMIQSYAPLVDTYMVSNVPDLSVQYNLGILVAQGRYIKWISDDDHIFPKGMRLAIAFMEDQPDIDVLQCAGIKVKGERLIPSVPKENFGERVTDPLIGPACLLGHVIRRQAFSIAGLFYPTMCAIDVDFLVRCIYRGLVVRGSNICLYWHTLHEHDSVGAHRKRWREEIDTIAESYGKRLVPNVIEETAPSESEETFLSTEEVNQKRGEMLKGEVQLGVESASR